MQLTMFVSITQQPNNCYYTEHSKSWGSHDLKGREKLVIRELIEHLLLTSYLPERAVVPDQPPPSFPTSPFSSPMT